MPTTQAVCLDRVSPHSRTGNGIPCAGCASRPTLLVTTGTAWLPSHHWNVHQHYWDYRRRGRGCLWMAGRTAATLMSGTHGVIYGGTAVVRSLASTIP